MNLLDLQSKIKIGSFFGLVLFANLCLFESDSMKSLGYMDI